MRNLDTAVRTFLIADVRGYTRFTQQHGDEAAGQLALSFAERCREVVEGHDGEVVELRGDEALCVFGSARRALRAAVELQTSFRRRTDARPVFPLAIGIGLDSGEAVPIEGGYRGGALNTAARLCSLAGRGETLATETVVSLARKLDGIRFVPRKPVRLKGLDQPLRTIEIVPEPGLPPLPAAPKENRSLVTRRRFAVGAIATLLLLSALVATVLARGGSAVEVSESSLAVIDPDTNEVVSSLPLSPGIGPVAVGEGGVWIGNPADRAVLRVDSTGTRLVKSIGLGIAPEVVVAGQGGVWAVEPHYSFAAITRIDPKANEPRATAQIDPAQGPRGDRAAFAAGAGALWLSVGDGHAYRLALRTLGDPTRIIGVDASEIAIGADAVWMLERDDQTVTRVDPATNAVRATIPIGAREPSSLAVGAGSVWVPDLAEDKVWRIDAIRNSVVGTIPVGNGPTAVAATDDAVWIANRFGRSVSRIDPATNSVVATIPLGQEPLGIAAWNDKVWVTVA